MCARREGDLPQCWGDLLCALATLNCSSVLAISSAQALVSASRHLRSHARGVAASHQTASRAAPCHGPCAAGLRADEERIALSVDSAQRYRSTDLRGGCVREKGGLVDGEDKEAACAPRGECERERERERERKKDDDHARFHLRQRGKAIKIVLSSAAVPCLARNHGELFSRIFIRQPSSSSLLICLGYCACFSRSVSSRPALRLRHQLLLLELLQQLRLNLRKQLPIRSTVQNTLLFPHLPLLTYGNGHDRRCTAESTWGAIPSTG